jgi:CheY-like chemotaxis protein
MRGTITVESEHGKGSRFSVEIPQNVVDLTPIGPEVAYNLKTFRSMENRAKGLARTPMPYGTVLVVDDVIVNLDVAKALMMPYGLKIHCASNGRRAIELVREGKDKYDMIFMDHMMPEMDGIEAVRVIRNEIDTEYAKTVPIVALTANAIVGNEAMFLAKGFQAFLSKPIDTLKLDALLNQWIRNRRGRKTAEQVQKMAGPTGKNSDARSLAGPEIKELNIKNLNIRGFNIEGLDVEAGCSRFGGENAYREVVRSYAAHTPMLLRKLRDVREEALSEYAIMVHGLKGSSYGICADGVGKMAEELEFAAKSGDSATVKAKNGQLIRAVEVLLSSLRSILEETPGNEVSWNEVSWKERKSAPAVALLRKLREYCTHYDVAGMEKAMSELERYAYESQGDLVKWLRQQVDDLEYKQILERLENIV